VEGKFVHVDEETHHNPEEQAGSGEEEDDEELALISLILTQKPPAGLIRPGLRAEKKKKPRKHQGKENKENHCDQSHEPSRTALGPEFSDELGAHREAHCGNARDAAKRAEDSFRHWVGLHVSEKNK
jgi:hypothetical protein